MLTSKNAILLSLARCAVITGTLAMTTLTVSSCSTPKQTSKQDSAQTESAQTESAQTESAKTNNAQPAQTPQPATPKVDPFKNASSTLIPAVCQPTLSETDAKGWECDPYINQWVCDNKTDGCTYQGHYFTKYVRINNVGPNGEQVEPQVLCDDKPAREVFTSTTETCKYPLGIGAVDDCMQNNVFVRKNTALLIDTIYCGITPAPSQNLESYKCEKHLSKMIWVCAGYSCQCGDIVIGHGAECIDGVPACKGLRAQTPLPGFGCFNSTKPAEYLCALRNGCDLGNGTVCKYSQKLENGVCVSSGSANYEEGNCPCGDDFCGFGAKCVESEDGSKHCQCGEDIDEPHNDCWCTGSDCAEDAQCDCNEEDGYCDCDPQCNCDEADEECDCYTRCKDNGKHAIANHDSGMGNFSCTSEFCGGTGVSDCENYCYRCDNPDGCLVGKLHVSMDEPSDNYCYHGYKSFHIDGSKDELTEATDENGVCVVEPKDGHCGADKTAKGAGLWRDYDYDTTILIYDNDACVGGTRYCRGKLNAPLPRPQVKDGYRCATINAVSKDNNDYKAWVCDKETGCLCGGQSCGYNSACINEKCIANDQIQISDFNTPAPKQSQTPEQLNSEAKPSNGLTNHRGYNYYHGIYVEKRCKMNPIY